MNLGFGLSLISRRASSTAPPLFASDSATLATLLAAANPAGGVTIELADGNYTAAIDYQYVLPVVIKSQTRVASPTVYTQRGGGAVFTAVTMNGFRNVTFENVKFYNAQVDPAVSQASTNALALSGAWAGLRIHRCEVAGSTIEKTARGNNWSRIIVQADGNKGRNLTFTENWVHDASRGCIFALNNTTTDKTNIVSSNYCADCYQFGIQFSGGSNITAAWNLMKNFFSVDVAFDTAVEGVMTSVTVATMVLPNVAAVTAVPNDGYKYMEVQAVTGPDATVLRTITGYVAATRTITFSPAFPNAPSTAYQYKIRDPSQAHQSYMPMTPDDSSDQYNIQWYGNIGAGTQHRAWFCSMAGLKLDDKDNTPPRHYVNCQIFGNLIVSSQGISMEISNGDADSAIAYNTIVYDENWLRRDSPSTRITGDTTNYINVENNVSMGLLPSGNDVGAGTPGGVVGTSYHATHNLRAGRVDVGFTPSPTLAAMFDGPTFTGVQDTALATWNAKTGGQLLNTGTYGAYGCGATAGFMTWPSSFETMPVAGTVNGSLPVRKPTAFSIPDETGIAVSTQRTTAPVQILGITAGTGVWFASGTAEVQILATDGVTVVTAWTTPTWTYGKSNVTIDPGQYVQVRMTSSGSQLTAVTADLRVGTGGDVYSITTLSGDVTAPILSSPTDTANGPTAATGSVSTDEGNGTLFWVVSTSATAPTAAQVIAGQIHTGAAASAAGSQTVSGTGVQNIAPSGLTASTAYWIHFAHRDAASNSSAVASGDGFTTASVFAARGAYFDGADYFSSTAITVAATSNGLMSFWIKNDDAAWNTPSRHLFNWNISTTTHLSLITASSGRMTFRLANNTATDTLTVYAAGGTTAFVPATWYHILIGWTAAGAVFYVNGVSVGTMTFASIDMAGSNLTRIYFGTNTAITNFWKGDIAHFWFDPSQTLDMTVQANREKFALAGFPVDLGSTGAIPTGTAPKYYYDGAGAAWDNQGTAGTVALTGALVASSTAPHY